MGLSSKQVSGDHLELEWTQTLLGSEGLELPKPRPTRRQLQTQQPDPLKCPRCESTNTKFCYYNNYNKSQPRHFCKACKRHWTKGGTLRNVPVGGGRKNKRVKRPNAATTSTAATTSAVRNNSLNQDIIPLGFSDHKSTLSDSYLKPIGSEGILESFTDIEELKGQVSWDFNGSFTGSTMHQFPHQTNQNLGFSILSSLSSFDTNPSSIIPNSFASLSDYRDIEKVENVEDSTITTTTMIMPSSSQPWQAPSTSNILDSSYWNWNDIESMVLADLNKPWEDPQFKP